MANLCGFMWVIRVSTDSHLMHDKFYPLTILNCDQYMETFKNRKITINVKLKFHT